MALVVLAAMLAGAAAAAERQVADLLTRPEAPPGVVFEIVSADADALRERLPRVRGYMERLRKRFPDLEVAVVSHGQEQFALQREHRNEAADVHRQVQSLVQEEQVPVHVCGTYADMHGVSAEDFPAYVDVAPSGPAQVRGYRELGYQVIVVD